MNSDNGSSFKIINAICVEIAKNKTNREVDEILVEELSELIQAVMKLERYNLCDNSLRCDYLDIYNNIFEELADVIIMICQFINKKKISHQNL